MKTISKIIIVLLAFLFSIPSGHAQRHNFASNSSLGLMLGGSYYIGDLNSFDHFRPILPSAGLLFKYHINSRLAIRGSFSYGKVAADDAHSLDPLHKARNLSFESDLFELAGGIEFNFLNYKLGNGKYFFTPYMFLELGFFRMDPMTNFKGYKVRLQPVGTEGQNSNLTNKDAYPLIQFCIPFGVGFKINLGNKVAISIEYGVRKTFTDYLDDVGEGKFIDRIKLAQQNGDIAAELNNRSDGEIQLTGNRGNPSTKDWYFMFGIGLHFSLGNPGTCFY